MTSVVRIARLTIAEAARRRILWVLAGLTLASVALTGWGIDRLVTLAKSTMFVTGPARVKFNRIPPSVSTEVEKLPAA